MKIVQSYYSTLIRADLSIIQLRIFVIIVRRCRALVYGKKYSKLLASQIDTSSLNMDFAVPFKTLLGKSHNYSSLHVALAEMEDCWKVSWWSREDKVWRFSSWVNNVEVNYREGLVRFSSPRWLVDYITDFSQGGFREYTFEKAMSLRNPNAARLYIIACSLSKPWAFDIDMLKKTLGLDGKYKNFSQFERRVLKPSQVELEKKGCNSFKYTVQRKGGKKGTPVKVTLIPVKNEKSLSDAMFIRSFREDVPQLLSSILAQRFRFSNAELAHNKNTLAAFSHIKNYEEKFIDIVDRAQRKQKNHGYIVNAMKSEVLKAKTEGNILPSAPES